MEHVGSSTNNVRSTPCATTRCIKDDDLAFAKLLQEQERAFYLMQHGDDEGMYEEAEGDASSEPGTTGQAEPCDDEEFARRLQEEEDRTSYAQAFGLPGADYTHCDAVVEGEETEDLTEALNYEDLQALGEFAGTVSKGLPVDVVAKLPVTTYGHLEGTDAQTDKCCICQVEYEAQDEVKTLPCAHYFHVDCVNQWLSSQKVCVLCNKEVTIAR